MVSFWFARGLLAFFFSNAFAGFTAARSFVFLLFILGWGFLELFSYPPQQQMRQKQNTTTHDYASADCWFQVSGSRFQTEGNARQREEEKRKDNNQEK